MSLKERFDSPGPKRILALDGGGIRGAVTVGYLMEIERLLRERHDDPSLLLCDYFDLIAGTSTGSIIATLLAIGKETSEIRDLYMGLGGKIFEKKRSWWKPWEIDDRVAAKFDSKPIEVELRKILGDRRLGSDFPDVRTGLCIVTKRADTQSTWPLINHPDGKYFELNAPIPLAPGEFHIYTSAPVETPEQGLVPVDVESPAGGELPYSSMFLPLIQEMCSNTTTWRGFRANTNPCDIWMYNEIITETRPNVIIEIGNERGGTAVFFRDMLHLNGGGWVLGIDIDHKQLVEGVQDVSNMLYRISDDSKCALGNFVNRKKP